MVFVLPLRLLLLRAELVALSVLFKFLCKRCHLCILLVISVSSQLFIAFHVLAELVLRVAIFLICDRRCRIADLAWEVTHGHTVLLR